MSFLNFVVNEIIISKKNSHKRIFLLVFVIIDNVVHKKLQHFNVAKKIQTQGYNFVSRLNFGVINYKNRILPWVNMVQPNWHEI